MPLEGATLVTEPLRGPPGEEGAARRLVWRCRVSESVFDQGRLDRMRREGRNGTKQRLPPNREAPRLILKDKGVRN